MITPGSARSKLVQKKEVNGSGSHSFGGFQFLNPRSFKGREFFYDR